MRIDQEIKLDFKDVLIRPKRSTLQTRAEVDLTRDYTFKHSQCSWKGVPIIASNMDHTGTFEMTESLAKHQLLTAIGKFACLQDWENFSSQHAKSIPYCFPTIGIKEEDIQILANIIKIAACPFICIDVANGYTQRFVDRIQLLRKKYPKKTLMAGNVVTAEMAEELILAGADIVKVGIGSGSVCTTRLKTGVGYPQLSAIIECADAVHGLGGHLCADGGCVSPGDVAKAFAGGADFVMLGGMFAGHEECAGEKVEENGHWFMRFYGMSSREAMHKYHGKMNRYRASEGRSVNIPYRGTVENTVLDILGGLRSTCTYVGAQRLKELSKRTTFLRVTQQLNEVFAALQVNESMTD
ncbi:GMP reductase [Rickettsiella grylli]|uniref:GMP reductase n=1 Tax=Rickettsiella grylli TaxID=59196 RepID=A8PN64_9COXI|nr:GMP reductase [Rickettsiella grylli]EDP46238.1 guanosine monophosphate reductase [Rickettsiella grylli]